MKKLSLALVSIMTLIALPGCSTMHIEKKNAERPALKKYQWITHLYAFKDSDKNLHLCVGIQSASDTSPIFSKLTIPKQDFIAPRFSTLIYLDTGKHLIDTKKFTPGCPLKQGAKRIAIKAVNVDDKANTHMQVQHLISELPEKRSGYSLYVLFSKKFRSGKAECPVLQYTNCINDSAYTWPRLIIKVNTETTFGFARTTRSGPHKTVTIVAAHDGSKRGYRVGAMLNAATRDAVRAPFKAVFVLGLIIMGVDRWH